MMKTRTNLIVALFALCFTGTVSDAYAWGWHKRKSVKNDSVVTSESKYDELVKKAKTREGMSSGREGLVFRDRRFVDEP